MRVEGEAGQQAYAGPGRPAASPLSQRRPAVTLGSARSRAHTSWLPVRTKLQGAVATKRAAIRATRDLPGGPARRRSGEPRAFRPVLRESAGRTRCVQQSPARAAAPGRKGDRSAPAGETCPAVGAGAAGKEKRIDFVSPQALRKEGQDAQRKRQQRDGRHGDPCGEARHMDFKADRSGAGGAKWLPRRR